MKKNQIILMLLLLFSSRIATAQILELQDHFPTSNAQNVSEGESIILVFDTNIVGPLDLTTVVITGSHIGQIAGIFSGEGTPVWK